MQYPTCGAAAFAIASLSAQSPQWLEADSAPRARLYAAVANDPLSGQPLLFSGHGRSTYVANQQFTADLWQWSGRAWVRRAATGPAARDAAAMALDLVRGRVVLYGGQTPAGSTLGDTWEYDGDQWLQRQPVQSPPASWGHAMAYDPLRQRTVLYGGYVDTWEWDGSNWLQPQLPLQPPLRYHTRMVFDGSVGGMLLFGGIEPSRRATVFDETWSYDGNTWTLIGSGQSPARFLHAMAFDPVRQRTVMFGGSDGSNQLRDTWEFGPAGWSLLPSAMTPQALDGGSLAFDPLRQTMLLASTDVLANGAETAATWSWDGSNWTAEAVPLQPPQRLMHGLVADARSGALLLYGGYSGDSQLLSDTWRFDGGAWTPLAPVTSPPPRHSAQIATFARRGRVVLFGGQGNNGVLGDTWEWDGNNWLQANPPTSPPPRARGAMAVDAARSVAVLFGGSDQLQSFADTWTWNGSNWQLAASQGPGARIGSAMVYDPVNAQVLLYGGSAASSLPLQNDLWSWNGAAWSLQPVTGPRPSPRMLHAMAFDPLRGRTVVHGGQVANAQGNTWEWDGSSWTQTFAVTAPDWLPMSCDATCMAWDPVRRAMVLYDGLELWTYATSAASAQSYGSGCGGSLGALQLRAAGRPFLGNQAFHCELLAAPAGQPAIVFVGFTAVNAPLGGGCKLLVSPSQTWVIGITGGNSTTALLPTPLPAVTALLGLAVRAQAAAVDASAVLGVALSNGLVLRLGH